MIKIKLTEKDNQINFSRTGKYIIHFDGVYYASNKGNFRIEVKNNENKRLAKLKVPFFKITEFSSIFHGRIQYAYIYITETGDYILNFKNIKDLKLSNSYIWPFWFLLPSNIKPEEINIEIGK